MLTAALDLRAELAGGAAGGGAGGGPSGGPGGGSAGGRPPPRECIAVHMRGSDKATETAVFPVAAYLNAAQVGPGSQP